MATTDTFAGRRARKAVLQRLADSIGDGFTDRELITINRLGTPFDVEPGRALIVKDQIGAEAFIIVSGAATVTNNGDVVAVVGAGDVLGEVSLLNLSRRNADVVADTKISGYVFNPREFSSLLFECPELGSRIRELAMDRDGAIETSE